MLELLRSSSLRMPLLVAVMMHLSQQLSGINCVSDVTKQNTCRESLIAYCVAITQELYNNR